MTTPFYLHSQPLLFTDKIFKPFFSLELCKKREKNTTCDSTLHNDSSKRSLVTEDVQKFIQKYGGPAINHSLPITLFACIVDILYMEILKISS